MYEYDTSCIYPSIMSLFHHPYIVSHWLYWFDNCLLYIIVVTDHKCAPMAIGIETKPGTRGPFVSNNPQHNCPIEPIEGTMGINEQKTPVFKSMVDIPGMLHEMNGSFHASRKAGTELVSTTCSSGSRTSNLKNGLGKYPMPSVTNANGLNDFCQEPGDSQSWELVRQSREGNHWPASKQSMPQ